MVRDVSLECAALAALLSIGTLNSQGIAPFSERRKAPTRRRTPRRGLAKTPARFGGAELNVPNTNPVSVRPSEPRRRFSGQRAINISLLRGEEPHSIEVLPSKAAAKKALDPGHDLDEETEALHKRIVTAEHSAF